MTPEMDLAERNSRAVRYAIGQFFTPEPVARYMASRVLELSPEHILDPAVGAGVLLRALPPTVARYGLDIDPSAVEISRAAVTGGHVEISLGDFLAGATLEQAKDLPLSRQYFDAVIANPPYIRHHLLSQPLKAGGGARYARSLGLKPSRLSSAYVYFLLESIVRLRPGGRLVFITPTEFLDVSYGRVVKEALLRHCQIDELVVFDEEHLTFGEGVLSTSAITVATKRTSPSARAGQRTVKVTEPVGPDLRVDVTSRDVLDPDPALPWTALTPSKTEAHSALHVGRGRTLGDFARVRRGIATGSKAFFCLTESERCSWGIEERFVVPCLTGARSVPADGPVDDEWFAYLKNSGARCWLLWCHDDAESLVGTRVAAYLEEGLRRGVHEAYNCRTRKPWYSVERVPPPDWFVTYMSRNHARFSRNLVGARCLTSLLNVWNTGPASVAWLDAQFRHPDIPLLLRSVGRTYGGGLGKTEPKELLRLPLPDYLGDRGEAAAAHAAADRPRGFIASAC
jgi:adenine-specific DNA methylase